MTTFPIYIPFLAALGALTLSVLLYVVVSVKIELWHMRKRVGADSACLRQRCEVLELTVSTMKAGLKEAEAQASVLVAPPSSRSGMNMNKRLQAARMSKRGERPEQIATALGLPSNEIALLLKVQRLTLPD